MSHSASTTLMSHIASTTQTLIYQLQCVIQHLPLKHSYTHLIDMSHVSQVIDMSHIASTTQTLIYPPVVSHRRRARRHGTSDRHESCVTGDRHESCVTGDRYESCVKSKSRHVSQVIDMSQRVSSQRVEVSSQRVEAPRG